MLCFDGVHLRPPREDEFAYLVELRNRERRWFVDQSELRFEDGAAWLATRHDDDRLNCIISNDTIIGTVGWVRVSVPGSCFEVGRLIGDYKAARKHRRDQVKLYRDLRVGCCLAFDHLFDKLHAEIVYVRNRPENTYIRNLIHEFSMMACAWPISPSTQQLECWRIVAAEWPIARNKYLAIERP